MATVSCNYVRGALGAIIRRGYAASSLLIEAGINPKLIEQSETRVSDVQMTRLVQLIWAELSDEFMGFTATPCQGGAFATMVQSVYRSDTLRGALLLGTRIYRLITRDIETKLIEVDDQAQLITRFKNPELDPDYFYHEFWLVIWHRFASWLIGKKIPLLGVSLTYPKPSHALELTNLFPCEHEFSAKQNRLIMDADYLGLAPIRSKTEVAEFLRHSPADLMTIPGEDLSLGNRIAVLMASIHKDQAIFPNLEDVASDLNLTTQSLHRQLKREGTHFQLIKDKIRRDIAITKLIKDKQSVQEISALLGYSEPRSFTRAFKAWTGLSPREYRRFV